MNSPAAAAEHGGYAVELYFDPALENQVLKAWNVLARRQISARLIELESRPHITLFAFPPSSLLDPQKLLLSLRSFAARHDPIPVTLSALSTFPSLSSLFLAVTPTLSLLNLHSQLFESLRKEGFEVGEECRPGVWVPGCDVARDLPERRVGDAIDVIRDLKLLPVSGCIVDVGVVEFSPVVREVVSFSLGSASEA